MYYYTEYRNKTLKPQIEFESFSMYSHKFSSQKDMLRMVEKSIAIIESTK